MTDWQMNTFSSKHTGEHPFSLDSLLLLSLSWQFPTRGLSGTCHHKAPANLSVRQARQELLTSGGKKKKPYIYLDLVGFWQKDTFIHMLMIILHTDSHFYSSYNICQSSNYSGLKKKDNPKNPCYHGDRIMKQEERVPKYPLSIFPLCQSSPLATSLKS